MEESSFDLKFVGNCPVCSEPYQKERTSVVDQGQDAISLHVDCAKCASSILLTVSSGLKGLVTTVGVPTDIGKSDIPKIKRSSRVTTDDVIKLHAFLEHNR